MELSSNSIRVLRCRMGWCQSELAYKLGVTSSEIRAWELGEDRPSFPQAQALELLFRQTETSVLEILQTPEAENELDSRVLESVNMRDLLREDVSRRPR